MDHVSIQVLHHRGYQGANSLPGVHMHHPHKKQGQRVLKEAQKAENQRISSDCIICENYYGWMKQIWTIMHERWILDWDRYPVTFSNCIALTNYHILVGNALQAEEGLWYRAHRQRVRKLVEERQKKRHAQFLASRTRQRHHIFAPIPSDSATSFALSTSTV